MGMSDLGEPPVSAGFTEEVALSRRGWGSYARLVATIDGADAGAGGVRKPNRSILLVIAVKSVHPTVTSWLTTTMSPMTQTL